MITITNSQELAIARKRLICEQECLSIYKKKVMDDRNRESVGKQIEDTQKAIREYREAIAKYQFNQLNPKRIAV